MALRDVPVGYCRHCHRDEEVVDGVLIEHDGYETGLCPGSESKPTGPPPEGTVSALTISPARRPEPSRDPRREVQDMARDAQRRRRFDFLWRH